MTTQMKITAMAATILAILGAPVSANLVVVIVRSSLPRGARGTRGTSYPCRSCVTGISRCRDAASFTRRFAP